MFALYSLALVLNPTAPPPRAVEPVAVFRLKRVAAGTFAERVKPLLPPSTRVATDTPNNTVIVFAKEADLREARALAARVDVPTVRFVVWMHNANPRYVASTLDAILWLDERLGFDQRASVVNVRTGTNQFVFVSATPDKARVLIALAEFFDSLASQK